MLDIKHCEEKNSNLAGAHSSNAVHTDFLLAKQNSFVDKKFYQFKIIHSKDLLLSHGIYVPCRSAIIAKNSTSRDYFPFNPENEAARNIKRKHNVQVNHESTSSKDSIRYRG